MKNVKNGWHTIANNYIYVESGKVLRGEYNGRMYYPYRKCDCNRWSNVSGITVAAFASGVRRGTIELK